MSYWNENVKPLGILIFRYARKRAGAGVRWAMRSPLRLTATAAVIVALAFAFHLLSKEGDDGSKARPVASASASDDGMTWRQVEAEPVASGHQSSSAVPPDASTVQPSEQPSTTPMPAPAKPEVDRDKAASTAEGFMRAYLSRQEGDDQWRAWSGELTNEQLADQFDDAKTVLDGRGASTVTDVTIGNTAFTGAPRDTEVRWSRPATATVTTEIGQPIKVTYEITAMKGQGGWVITDAVERGWTAAR